MIYEKLTLEPRLKEFHSNVGLKFGELVDEGMITLGAGVWDWQAYSDEQKERIIEQMKRKWYYYELDAPGHEWQLKFIQVLTETQEKYNPLYKAIDEGLNPVYSFDEWEKRRDVGSDFPQTRIPNTRNNDYASEGTDMERETIRISDPIETIKNLRDSYTGIDQMFLEDMEPRIFSCLIAAKMDAIY